MTDTLLQQMMGHIENGEGRVNQPYKINGQLTTGVGFKVTSPDAFAALPFKVKDTKTGQMRYASDDEKRQEFERIKSISEGELKKDPNPFRLEDTDIDAKLKSEIETRIDKIKTEIGVANWGKLTDGQKTAVLDIHYAAGGLDTFKKLKAAIERGDAQEMANEAGFHSDGKRNWEREARNQAAILGVSQEEGRRIIQDKFKDQKPVWDGPVAPPKEAPKPTQQPGAQPPAKSDSPQRPERAPDSASEQSNASQAGQDALPPAPENPAGEKSGALRGEDDFSLAKVGGAVWDGITSVIGIRSAHASELPDAVRQQMKPALDQGRPETPADPRAASLIQMASAPIDNPGKAALLKPMEKLTEDEMKAMLNHAQGDYRGFRAGDPLKAHTYEKVQDWHVAMYGDAPQANDGGKPIEPQPIRPIPRQASPHTTPDGRDLWQATAKIGHQVADAAGTDGYEHAVKGLQRGLNILNQAHPLPERSPAYGPYTKLGPVIEDGQYGPQTDFALKHATARLGPAKVQDGLALGRFNTFARTVQRNGNPEGLENKTHSLFGPLFRGAADGKAPKVEGGVLQETLNGFGQDLKVDNWIGPKTTQAFSTVLRENDADDVTRAFGRGLGFL